MMNSLTDGTGSDWFFKNPEEWDFQEKNRENK